MLSDVWWTSKLIVPDKLRDAKIKILLCDKETGETLLDLLKYLKHQQDMKEILVKAKAEAMAILTSKDNN